MRERSKKIFQKRLDFRIEIAERTSPIHVITRAKNSDLSNVMRYFKKFTCETLMNEIRQSQKAGKSGC